MLSLATLDSLKINKDQVQELIHLVSHQDANLSKGTTPDPDSPHPASLQKSTATKQSNDKHGGAAHAQAHAHAHKEKDQKSNASKSNKSDQQQGHGHVHDAGGGTTKKSVPRSSQVEVKLLHILSEEEIGGSRSGFLKCPCCPKRQPKRSGPDEQTVEKWRQKYCNTYGDFTTLLTTTAKNGRLAIPSFNEVKHELSYENDPTAHGLSTFGGLMWILTYGIQHLVDPAHTAQNLTKDLTGIRATYQEIGSTAQKFVIVAEQYCIRVGEIHKVVVDLVKRLLRRYKFTKDPLYLRPQYKPKAVHLRKRIGYEPPRNSKAGNIKDGEDDELFHVNWSPLTIVVQYPTSRDWDIFTVIPIEHRVTIYKIFIKHALDQLETWIQKFTTAVNYTSASSNEIEIGTGSGNGSDTSVNDAAAAAAAPATTMKQNSDTDTGQTLRLSADDITTMNHLPLYEIIIAMQKFIKTLPGSSAPKSKPSTTATLTSSSNKNPSKSMSTHDKFDHEPIDVREVEHLQCLVEDFWFTMDSMYEISVEIERLIQETRDAVRTCYTYATHFYKWNLPNYETFDPRPKSKEYKANQKQTKINLAKILGQRRFSDAAMFISLADFTSSIYQNVAQNHEYAVGGYVMKISTWDDEETETWGLLGDGAK